MTVHSHIDLSRKLEEKALFIVVGGVEKCGIAKRFPSPYFGRLFHASVQAATKAGAL
ncbi:hypothetical protein ACPOL_2943 [Acidisarcina polymorpha]|uniref:Uncharacterized protein n=1 Tax=Acidisarcina polymorpha TaxID=2211140 RepID=A0A2Z5G0V1_9BACT|nr:hypothetical protein ACPOL_2943 [Acidisarcina polymorpha]